MDLDRKHRSIERDVKQQIQTLYRTDTGVIDYTLQEGTEYVNEVNELGKNILTYLVKFEPDKVTNWITTNTFDFD